MSIDSIPPPLDSLSPTLFGRSIIGRKQVLVKEKETGKTWAQDILAKVNKYIEDVSVPDIIMKIDKNKKDILVVDYSKLTNDQLEEYLALFGGYKSYLESQLSLIEAKRGILEAGFEEGLNKMYYTISQRDQELGGKKRVKETIRGEALSMNKPLKNTKQDLIEVEAICVRMRGLRDAYTSAFSVVSRIVTLRTSRGDQV